MRKLNNSELIIDKITNVKVYTVDENGNKIKLADWDDVIPVAFPQEIYEPPNTQDVGIE